MIDDVLSRLGLDRFVLQVHAANFPADVADDLGRGTPYSPAAARFFEFVAELGFNAVQLGPRGLTGRGNASPYDGTIFSRNPLDFSPARLIDQGRLARATFQAIRAAMLAEGAGVFRYPLLFDAYQQILVELVRTATEADRAAARGFLAQHEAWLVPDAIYSVLCDEHGSGSWHHWNRTSQGVFDQMLYCPTPGSEHRAAERLTMLRAQYEPQIENYALIQWLLDEEHRALRERLAKLNLAVYADLQVGFSVGDMWAWRHLLLPGYAMGAPPSRTNPDGQPWGYPAFDPEKLGTTAAPGPALDFVRLRIAKNLDESDGVRIDHPHGWVDPWVYRSDDRDPLHAVQTGARLFSSPDDPRHPRLRAYAVARADQIDPSQPGYADGYVRDLDDAQTTRYARQIDVIVDELKARGGDPKAISCEVLSTLPYPVRRVMERHGLGRFRVTQKIKLDDPSDVYRIENAEPDDWIMLGTHDTPPTWMLAQDWCRTDVGRRWGEYLAGLAQVPATERSAFIDRVATSAGELVHELFTAMLTSRARNVVLFAPDLFGMTERYNEPGVVNDVNWLLRLPTNFREAYDERKRRGAALDVERCLAAAAAKPDLTVAGDWRRLLVDRDGEALAKRLPPWLVGRRWFAGKAKPIRRVQVVDVVPLAEVASRTEVCLLLVRVEYVSEEAENYLLPLGFATDAEVAAWPHDHSAAILATVRVTTDAGPVCGVLYDAFGDEALGRLLLELIAEHRTAPGRGGRLIGEPLQTFRTLRGPADDDLAVRALRVEQSNSSLAFGNRLLLKLFRKLDVGRNPDLEIGRFLTEQTDFRHAPQVAGSLEYEDAGGTKSTVGILHAYVRNDGDAWSFTLPHVRQFYERVLSTRRATPPSDADFPPPGLAAAASPAPAVVALCGDYLDAATLLGRRTAEMHLALTSATGDPDFAAEPFTPFDQRALYDAIRDSARRSIALLHSRLLNLPHELQDDARRLLDLEPTLLARYESLVGGPLGGARIRCHGDYHLGQVLHSGDDFVIVDFEGEPAKRLDERRQKRSPLRDAAGMIRSFHYAAHAVLLDEIATRVRPDELPTFARWAKLWSSWTATQFMASYLATVDAADFLPPATADRERLLNVFVLEKALYELAYELNNRPTWVRVPLAGILQVLE